ncbi:hypothetical protein GCM10009081_31320 [Brevundimonas nasdae]
MPTNRAAAAKKAIQLPLMVENVRPITRPRSNPPKLDDVRGVALAIGGVARAMISCAWRSSVAMKSTRCPTFKGEVARTAEGSNR